MSTLRCTGRSTLLRSRSTAAHFFRSTAAGLAARRSQFGNHPLERVRLGLARPLDSRLATARLTCGLRPTLLLGATFTTPREEASISAGAQPEQCGNCSKCSDPLHSLRLLAQQDMPARQFRAVVTRFRLVTGHAAWSEAACRGDTCHTSRLDQSCLATKKLYVSRETPRLSRCRKASTHGTAQRGLKWEGPQVRHLRNPLRCPLPSCRDEPPDPFAALNESSRYSTHHTPGGSRTRYRRSRFGPLNFLSREIP